MLYGGLCPPVDYNENHKKLKEGQIHWPSQRTKKTLQHEGDNDDICSWCVLNGPQRFRKDMEDMKIVELIETMQTSALSRKYQILNVPL